MSTLRNKVTLVGRLGMTPVVQTAKDYKFTRFRIATNERFKNKKGEWTENTQWHNVVAWGRNAENLSRLAEKGSEIMIEGKLSNYAYESKDGERRFTTEIETSEFRVITPRTLPPAEPIETSRKTTKSK